MKQSSLDLNLSNNRARKRELLFEMDHVVPWTAQVELIVPNCPVGKNGTPPFALETMLLVHFMQQWFTLSDPVMQEAFFDIPLCRELAKLDAHGRLPDESTILRFRHRLEEHKLAEQILATVNELLTSKGLLLKVGKAVHAALIAAPTSTNNKDKARDPEMYSCKKGNQWYFGMKAHIGVDADSGLVHTVRRTAGHVHDINEGNALLHGKESMVFADAGYQGIDKRPGKRKALDKSNADDAMLDEAEKLKADFRAKVEHPFRVIKRQFGHVKVRYRGLKKNTQQLMTLFALSNLWMVRSSLVGAGA